MVNRATISQNGLTLTSRNPYARINILEGCVYVFTYPESGYEGLDLVFGFLAAHFEGSVLGSSSDSLNHCYQMEMWNLL